MKKTKQKNQKWIRFRHRLVTRIIALVLRPYCRFKYGLKVEKFKEQGKKQYVILYNHQTAFDQFFVGLAFSGAIYYVASEDIFSNGFISRLIKWLVNPIPIKKQTTDVRAVLNCIKVAKEGGTIAIAPEGNRTYSGKTEYMKPQVVSLVRATKLPLALFRIEGGYGVHPRWSDAVRHGKMRAYVSRVIEKEEYDTYTDDEFFNIIRKELYVNEANTDNTCKSKVKAEYLERAIYVCPKCNLSEFESHGDIIRCKKCGLEVRYTDTTELSGVNTDFPFKFVNDWYEYQCDYIRNCDLDVFGGEAIYKDNGSIYEIEVYKKKNLLYENAEIFLFKDRIHIKNSETILDLDFEKTSVVTVLGKNKLNIYYRDKLYQVKSNKRFNA